jgi:hypothetical protein
MSRPWLKCELCGRGPSYTYVWVRVIYVSSLVEVLVAWAADRCWRARPELASRARAWFRFVDPRPFYAPCREAQEWRSGKRAVLLLQQPRLGVGDPRKGSTGFGSAAEKVRVGDGHL